MKQASWWGRKSGAGKAMLVLSLLLILGIALCIATPALEPRVNALMHVPQGEGWGTLGTVLWELYLILFTMLLMALTALWWLVSLLLRRKTASKDSNA